jgi:hypothetical protein
MNHWEGVLRQVRTEMKLPPVPTDTTLTSLEWDIEDAKKEIKSLRSKIQYLEKKKPTDDEKATETNAQLVIKLKEDLEQAVDKKQWVFTSNMYLSVCRYQKIKTFINFLTIARIGDNQERRPQAFQIMVS